MALIVSVDDRPTPVMEEFDVLDSDDEEVNNLSRKIEEVLQQAAEGTGRNVILAALAKVGAARIKQSDASEEVDG